MSREIKLLFATRSDDEGHRRGAARQFGPSTTGGARWVARSENPEAEYGLGLRCSSRRIRAAGDADAARS